VPPTVDDGIDLQRLFPLRSLGYADQSPPRVHLLDYPIAVVRLVAKQRVKGQAPDKRLYTDRVITIAGQQDEPNQVAERIGQGEDFGRPSSFRLPYSLTESPPFEPCPAR